MGIALFWWAQLSLRELFLPFSCIHFKSNKILASFGHSFLSFFHGLCRYPSPFLGDGICLEMLVNFLFLVPLWTIHRGLFKFGQYLAISLNEIMAMVFDRIVQENLSISSEVKQFFSFGLASGFGSASLGINTAKARIKLKN